jgi:hypothetical protein
LIPTTPAVIAAGELAFLSAVLYALELANLLATFEAEVTACMRLAETAGETAGWPPNLVHAGRAGMLNLGLLKKEAIVVTIGSQKS